MGVLLHVDVYGSLDKFMEHHKQFWFLIWMVGVCHRTQYFWTKFDSDKVKDFPCFGFWLHILDITIVISS